MLQNTAAFFIWADLRIAQLVAFSAGSVLRHYRPTRLVDRLRRTGDCRRWRRAAEELDEAPSRYQVLLLPQRDYAMLQLALR